MKDLAIGQPGDSTATLRPWRGRSQVEAALRGSPLAMAIMRNP